MIVETVGEASRRSLQFLGAHPELATLIDDIDAVYADVRQLPALAGEPALAFLGVSESSFLAAAQLAAGGQVAPSFMASRGALEAAIIGWYLQPRPELVAIWNARVANDEAKRVVREAIHIPDLRSALRSANAAVERQFGIAYDKTLNFAAEPDSGSSLEVRHAVYGAAYSALMSLFVFLVAFPQIFAGAGLPERLMALADRLTACFPEDTR
ncbi:MAG: hypothetical protein JWO56_802 [Acidobacteria bacterium]|nr:hypothetical protein [Acidobacteriota bacterium]